MLLFFLQYKSILLSPKESSVLLENNLVLGVLFKLERLPDGFEILHCGVLESYLSNQTISLKTNSWLVCHEVSTTIWVARVAPKNYF